MSNNNSTNAIVSSIGALVSRVDTLTTRVDTLTTSVNAIKSYIDNESRIQEKRDVHAIRDIINESGTYNIEISHLRYFYIPTANNLFTDIDGCLLVRSPVPTARVRNSSGVNHNMNVDSTYIIETKHGFTKHLIDRKLDQFCTILKTFEDLHNGSIRVPNTPRSNFDHMVHNHELRKFPQNIIFIFSSDDIDTYDIKYILSINSGSLTEDLYNEYSVYTFKNHQLYKEIINDNTIGGHVKRKIREINTIDDVISIFTRNTDASLSRHEHVIESQKSVLINKYGLSIINMMIPLTEMQDCYNLLKGRLRVFINGTIRSE